MESGFCSSCKAGSRVINCKLTVEIVARISKQRTPLISIDIEACFLATELRQESGFQNRGLRNPEHVMKNGSVFVLHNFECSC